ncbi:MAG: hypothetical protein MUF14_01040, partial [Hyphomonadaceae bacterium]|nr:hypothetical protein [Hyphomonadaceae bacterium]
MNALPMPSAHAARPQPLSATVRTDWVKVAEVAAWTGLAGLCLTQVAVSPEALLAHASRCLDGQAAGGAVQAAGIATILGHCAWCWGALGAASLAAIRLLVTVPD